MADKFSTVFEQLTDGRFKDFSDQLKNAEKAFEAIEKSAAKTVKTTTAFDSLLKAHSSMGKISSEVLKKSKKYSEVQSKFVKEYKGELESIKRLTKELHQAESEGREGAAEALKEGISLINERSQKLTESFQKETKNLDERIKKQELFKSVVLDTVDLMMRLPNLLASMDSLAGVRDNLGSGSRYAKEKGAQAKDSGMGATAKALQLVSKSLGALSSLANLVKIFNDIRGQAIGLNKDILQGSAVTDIFTGKATDLKSELETVREAVTRIPQNIEFGADAQEQVAILNAFKDQAVSISKITKGLTKREDKVKAIQNATRKALKFSRLFGISSTEAASQMAEMMEDLGLSLKDVAKRFSNIYEAASLSTFSGKQFFSIVSQATSGMALYNVQVEQAASLLNQFSRILGKKVGPQFLGFVNEMFKGDSIQERLKKIMIAGVGNVRETFKLSAESIASDFMSTFKDGEFSKVLSSMGVEIKGMEKIKDAKDLVSVLSKMKPEDQRKLIAKVGVTNAKMAQRLESVVEVSKAQRGGLTQMARGMDSLDLGGKMQFALTQASVLFKKPIHELSSIQLAAYQNATGMSMEQIKQLERIEKRFKGNFELLTQEAETQKQILAKQTKGIALTDKELEFQRNFKKNQEKNAAAMGAMVTENGKIVQATKDSQGNLIQSNRELKGVRDMVQHSGEVFKQAAKEGAPEQLQLARQVAEQTTDFNKILKNVVAYTLERIYQVLTEFYSYVTSGSLSNEEKKAKKEALAKAKEGSEKLDELIKITTERRSKLLTQSKQLKRGARKEALKDIAGLDKFLGTLYEKRKGQREVVEQIAGSGSGRNLTQSVKKTAQMALSSIPGLGGIFGDASKASDLNAKDFLNKAKRAVEKKGGDASGITEGEDKLLKEVKGQTKIQKEENRNREKKTEDATYKALKRMEKDKRMQVLRALESAGMKVSEADRTQFVDTGVLSRDTLNQSVKTKRGTSVGVRTLLEWARGSASEIRGSLGGGSQDFLLRLKDDGRVSVLNRFNPMDNLAVVGTKPGGGLGQAARGTSGPPRSSGQVVVNVNGGDEQRVYNVVLRALKTAGINTPTN